MIEIEFPEGGRYHTEGMENKNRGIKKSRIHVIQKKTLIPDNKMEFHHRIAEFFTIKGET